MPVELVAEKTITVGSPVTVDGPSPGQPCSVVFEADAETGYLYALDLARDENPIVDAMHIDNVSDVTDRRVPAVVQLVWSPDGLKAARMINKYPHAIFDFEARRGYCRTGFPPPSDEWTQHAHDWSDAAVGLFR